MICLLIRADLLYRGFLSPVAAMREYFEDCPIQDSNDRVIVSNHIHTLKHGLPFSPVLVPSRQAWRRTVRVVLCALQVEMNGPRSSHFIVAYLERVSRGFVDVPV